MSNKEEVFILSDCDFMKFQILFLSDLTLNPKIWLASAAFPCWATFQCQMTMGRIWKVLLKLNPWVLVDRKHQNGESREMYVLVPAYHPHSAWALAVSLYCGNLCVCFAYELSRLVVHAYLASLKLWRYSEGKGIWVS